MSEHKTITIEDKVSQHEIDKLPQYRRKLRRLERRQQMVRTYSVIGFASWGLCFSACALLLWAMYAYYQNTGLSGGLIAFGMVLVPFMLLFCFPMIGYVYAFITGHDPVRAKSIADLIRRIDQVEALLGKSISWLNERKLLENIDPAVLTDANMARRRFLRQHCVSGITFIILVTLGFWLIYDEWPVVSRFLDSETSLLPHIVYGVLFAFFVLVIKDDTSLGFSRYLKDSFYKDLLARIDVRYRQKAFFLPVDIAEHGLVDTHADFFCDEAFSLTYHNRRVEFQEFTNRSLPPDLKPKIIEKKPGTAHYMRGNSDRRLRGIMARIELRRPLQSQTIVYANALEKKFSRPKFRSIKLLNDELEERYTVQSMDEVESRYIFDPHFMEKFLRLAEHLGTDRIVASFKDKELLLLLLTDKNHFEVGFLREPLVPESFEPLFRHVMIYQEIVYTLELAPNRGL